MGLADVHLAKLHHNDDNVAQAFRTLRRVRQDLEPQFVVKTLDEFSATAAIEGMVTGQSPIAYLFSNTRVYTRH